jgi:hypothetical protein
MCADRPEVTLSGRPARHAAKPAGAAYTAHLLAHLAAGSIDVA